MPPPAFPTNTLCLCSVSELARNEKDHTFDDGSEGLLHGPFGKSFFYAQNLLFLLMFLVICVTLPVDVQSSQTKPIIHTPNFIKSVK